MSAAAHPCYSAEGIAGYPSVDAPFLTKRHFLTVAKGAGMTKAVGVLIAATLSLSTVQVRAESLRCNGNIASEGDSRLSVAFKCGQPMLKDAFCAPVYVGQVLQPLPEPFASSYVPCLYTEEWLYDRGPGNLLATVRFRSGIVQTITYGRTPQ